MALGVLSAFHQHQVAVPGEKSVVAMTIPTKVPFLSGAEYRVARPRPAGERGGAADPRQHQRGASYLIHSAGAPGDTPFQRRPNRAGKDLQAIAEQLRAIAHRLAPDAKGGETRLITLPLN